MNIRLYPSTMCMDFSCLKSEIRSLEEGGVHGFHVDVMDGSFVRNKATPDCLALVRRYTKRPIEVHLMVASPFDYLEGLYPSRPEIIYVHAEAQDPECCLKGIRAHGYGAGMAVCPDTTVKSIEPLLPFVDQLLILRVQPGRIGQKNIAHVEEKIEKLLHWPERTFSITLDGAISADVISLWGKQGIGSYVCGLASGLFPRNGQQARAAKVRELCGYTNDLCP